MKILLTVDSEEKIAMSIMAVQHLSEMDDTEEVEVVYLNGGIAAVVEKNRIKPLLENKKVKVVACGTSMKARNISEDELAEGVIYVPASLKEVIAKKHENYEYLVL
ncbi:DrsE family protein [Candidatus Mancarchaeum acidiphilum]|uniref:DrsE family protein n=1 Tax=Candidatus Mancarchaeum acidiphilum TaxID=1920749 RepID=A0A218NMP9_9ARCH|nr:DsrE family protein [Candidatus Mancarchaeum acidiphilum]ASI13742.1 DrsE family protein [Candidatus Mancarchaeum acidiphilum]